MNWNDIPSLSALRAFEAAARHGSLSAAARDLNVTHAAIGQHVRALEDHFAQPLLQRDGRGMSVTPQGQRLATALTEAFAQIASASNDLLDHGKTRAIRVVVTPSFAANWLMPRIGDFWAKHPDIDLELLPSMQLVDMRRDTIDVAIRYGKGNWTGAHATRLMAAGHTAVAAPSYLSGRKITCLEDLKGSRWLLDNNRPEERLWIAENGVDLTQETVTEFSTEQLTRDAVLSGLGVTVLPAPIAAGHISSGALVKLCAEEGSDAAYHVLIRPEVISPARDAFVKWLRSEVAAQPYQNHIKTIR